MQLLGAILAVTGTDCLEGRNQPHALGHEVN